jgi:glutathione S-transferase
MYKLYGRRGSGSLAVQIMLEEIGAPYERVWVSRDAAEVARFRATNPTGRVPALVFPDGSIMFESAAILIHLAEVNPQFGLAPPAGSSRHAVFLQWMVFLSANVYEAVLRIYYPARYTSRGEADAEVVRQQATEDYCTHLGVIGPALGPYVLGAEFSIADVYLYMLASWYPGEKAVLYSRVAGLRENVQRVAARPAVIKVEAEHVE